jgi:glycosyltransferase involved in cell wall biosynthesis
MDKVKKSICKRRLRIAMIGHKRIPSREGGIEVVVNELSKGLTKKGCEVTVYNRKGHHVGGKEHENNIHRKMKSYKDIRIITVPTIDIKGLAAVTSSFFASIAVLLGHYDYIHYHGEGPALMLLIPHIFGIRTVVTIHGLDWMRSKWGGLAAWYLMQGERIAARYADKLIVLSRNLQKYFMEVYHRDTVYIPNGVKNPVIREAKMIKRWGINKDSYILFLGRIVPEKGIHYLIEAFKKVNTDKRLVIAGGASDTDEYMTRLINKAKDDKRILFTGFVQGQVLEELYSNAYLYTLPSDLEGMPLSLLEAMSYNNCCLVSSIPECTEVVGDKALTFEKGNTKALYLMLQKLCDNPDIVYEYKAKARDFICKRYSWDKVVTETLKLYKQ